MSETNDFLVELGTEELPPKVLRDLANAFKVNIQSGLASQRLQHDEVEVFATPRRLAVLVKDLETQQAPKAIERKGPPLDRAFDEHKFPTKAATAFAKSNGVDVYDLLHVKMGKGTYLVFRGSEPGKASQDVLPDIVKYALDQLPIPKRMRWGSRSESFVRPVHWLLMLHGKEIVPCEIMGLKSERLTYGHRFMAPQEISIEQPSAYKNLLVHAGEVVPSFTERRKQIETQVLAAAQSANGQAIIDNDLLNEVTALVEKPFVILGDFDKRYLDLPQEVLIETLQQHQKYFPLRDSNGEILNKFITISNINSKDPEQVKLGNERVIHPRLADAEFFYKSDLKRSLESRIVDLDKVVFQRDLGSLGDKVRRIEALGLRMLSTLEKSPKISEEQVKRAANLCKCDLLTDMVGEFPELQGVMGRYYAIQQEENLDVALAIDEHYLPRFSGDRLPSHILGQVISIADKLDTIVGIFAIGKKPSGTRDPFSLRRQSIGILRILIEEELNFDLRDLIAACLSKMPEAHRKPEVVEEVFVYMQERARGYFQEKNATPDQIASVFATNTTSPLDMLKRLKALQKFVQMPAAPNLAAANKRVANILKKNSDAIQNLTEIDVNKMTEKAEYAFYQALQSVHKDVDSLMHAQRYTDVLLRLARLKDPVDDFFNDVMVMSDDPIERNNRLNLLQDFHTLSTNVAHLSLLDLSLNEAE